MRIVILTGYPSIRTAVEAIKLGATDYLAKPANVDEVVSALQRNRGNDGVPIGKKPMSVHRAEWEYISLVLHENDGNISASARALSMDRRTLPQAAKRPLATELSCRSVPEPEMTNRVMAWQCIGRGKSRLRKRAWRLPRPQGRICLRLRARGSVTLNRRRRLRQLIVSRTQTCNTLCSNTAQHRNIVIKPRRRQ
jgi:CheY-like chemotaxis protein